MQVHSYRNYLDSLDDKTDTGLLGKILLITGIVVLVLVGVTSSLLYYESKKETPIRKQAAFIQNIKNTLIAQNQSVDEILASFQVAGAKIQIVDNLKESSQSASGFFTSLDDLERSLSKLELMNKNLESTKLSFTEIDSPLDLSDLKDGFITFIVNSQINLEDIYAEQTFVKDVLYASGPSFYLPVLTDETIWRQNNKDAIATYYKDVKLQADETLKNLSKLTPPEAYKSYFDTQLAYLTLLVDVSDKIINILIQKDSLNPDDATQIEKAYQQLINAKGQNEKISETLLQEKKKIFDLVRNQQKFAQIKAQQNALLSDLEQKYVALPPTKIDKLPIPLQIKTFLLIDKD